MVHKSNPVKLGLIILVCSSLVLTIFNPAVAQPFVNGTWQKQYENYEKLRQDFNQPPLWYAPHTFWFWDAPLDSHLTAAMAKEITQQRLNPGYAHARHSGAPAQPYPMLPYEQWLSPLWFKSFDLALKQAENAAMTLGYCDEYWWPSGQAAGRVLENHPELEATSLQWQRQVVRGPSNLKLPASKFTIAGKLNKDERIGASTLTIIGAGAAFSWPVPAGTWVVYSYKIYHHPGIDGGRVNYLDPKLLDAFIPIAHECYETYFGVKMGQSIPGVFVDHEGDFGWKMAWSEYLPVRYQEMKKRDLRIWLPLLTEQDDQGLWAKARYDWFDVVADIYCTHFLGRMSDWLQQHNMYYISNLWEETLMLQTRAVGDFIRAQRSVSLPGTDCLVMKSQQVHDFKETQSVCEFENRPFMSEIMGVAGWDQTPVQMKMTANAITAWGVNHVVPHGINLNRKLETIPYPADWFTENPYWQYLHNWTDFVRRAAFINRQGRLETDILLLNPLESVWALAEGYFTSNDGNEWPDKVHEIDKAYSEAMAVLSRERLDYLVADRYYMEKAKIVTSRLTTLKNSQKALQIGDFQFHAMVVPPMVIVARTTAAKILEFANADGTVVILGALPQGSPEMGAVDSLIIKQMEKLKTMPSVVNLAGNKEKMKLLPVSLIDRIDPQMQIVSGSLPLLLSHRKIGDCDFYWLANNENKAESCHLSLRDGKGGAEKWDCETGAIYPVDYEIRDNRAVIGLDFKPYEAFWLVFNPNKPALAEKKKAEAPMTELPLTGSWTLSLRDTLLKVASAKILLSTHVNMNPSIFSKDYDDSNWQFRDLIGPLSLDDSWHVPVFYFAEEDCKRFYRYRFNLMAEPVTALLNVAADEISRIWINGQQVAPGKFASVWNRTDVISIGNYLQQGKNLIAVEVYNRYGQGSLMIQGKCKLKKGHVIELATHKNWRESTSEMNNWQNPEFDDTAWQPAVLATGDIEKKQRELMEPPKILFSSGTALCRINVPIGAKKVVLPAVAARAQIRLDGVPVTSSGNILMLPEAAKLLTIWFDELVEEGFAGPIEFYCGGSTEAMPGSWLDLGLHQFTGFIDYETTFEFPVSAAGKKTELHLGQVLHMAEVWINGKKIGERLWPPFKFDISGFVQPGSNKLQVRVGNLIANQMWYQDAMGYLRNWGWKERPGLESFAAGLFGPVRVWIWR